MKISIIGIGNIGGSLGLKWAECGHEIFYGVRDVNSDKVKALLEKTDKNVHILNPVEAVNKGDVVVLAVPFKVVKELLEQLGDLTSKVIIDATNPLDIPTLNYNSGAEAVKVWANSDRVVKAFNTTGAANLRDPNFNNTRIDTYICGDNITDKQMVKGLAEEIGFTPINTGGLDSAAMLESMARLWVTLSQKEGMGPNIAFKLLNKQE